MLFIVKSCVINFLRHEGPAMPVAHPFLPPISFPSQIRCSMALALSNSLQRCKPEDRP